MLGSFLIFTDSLAAVRGGKKYQELPCSDYYYIDEFDEAMRKSENFETFDPALYGYVQFFKNVGLDKPIIWGAARKPNAPDSCAEKKSICAARVVCKLGEDPQDMDFALTQVACGPKDTGKCPSAKECAEEGQSVVLNQAWCQNPYDPNNCNIYVPPKDSHPKNSNIGGRPPESERGK